MENGKALIAIVDDEPDMCSLLVMLCQKRGIPVSFIAYSCHEALSKWGGGADPKPDIVLLDYRLQSRNGVDLAREILMARPSIKIVFLSSAVGAMKNAYGAGAVLFLKKPVSTTTIINAIDIVHNNQGKYEDNGVKFLKCTY
jgi:FixJ family two-component response regulator